jgi:hypothetical protein
MYPIPIYVCYYSTVARRAVSRQRLCKYVPAARDKHATIYVLLETVLLVGPCKGVIKKKIEGRIDSFEGGTVQREHEPGSRGIAIVKAVTRKSLVQTLQAGKDLA